MHSKLIVAPDELVMSRFYEDGSKVKSGCLLKHVDVSELGDEPDVRDLVYAQSGQVKVFVYENSKSRSKKVDLLLPSLSNFIAIHLNKQLRNKKEMSGLISNWTSYFTACQQVLLNFPQLFSALDIEVKDERLLQMSAFYALADDLDIQHLQNEWSTFVVKKYLPDADSLTFLSELAAQHQAIWEKNRQAKKSEDEVNELTIRLERVNETANSAAERADSIKRTLDESTAEKEFLQLQITQLQEELEHLFLDVKDKESEIKELVASHDSLTQKLESHEQNVAERDASKAENALLLSQLKQLQEKLDKRLHNRGSAPVNTLVLLRSSVANAKEKLALRIKNFSMYKQEFDNFDFEVIAENVKPEGFCDRGILELRVLSNRDGPKAPLQNWQPNEQDLEGRKLRLILHPYQSPEEAQATDELNIRDKGFLHALFNYLTTPNRFPIANDIPLERPYQQWQQLFAKMSAVL
ncbi:hypothetical protein PN836_016560 [Ningiella sp. W23]|uniref:hypothetical protein n=1 Tax=Ningiella sp. W23 TaxID=3023715 RepID=UPI00375634C9